MYYEDDKKYATVRWSVDDVLTLRPDLSIDSAETFLIAHERVLQDVMVEAGWSALENLLDRIPQEE